MDDLHPARGGLLIGEPGDSYRRQYAGGRVLERRDRAGAGVVLAGQAADPGSWGRNSLPNGPRLWAAAWAPSAAVCACSNDRTYRVEHC
jgi:hypothetical protein